MPIEEITDLKLFMKPFPEEVREIGLFLREFAWELFPDCNELIYDNYNALAFGWSLTDKLSDTFCSVALFGSYCHFGFYWGTSISDPEKKLQAVSFFVHGTARRAIVGGCCCHYGWLYA